MLLEKMGKTVSKVGSHFICQVLWAAALCNLTTWEKWQPFLDALSSRPPLVRASSSGHVIACQFQGACRNEQQRICSFDEMYKTTAFHDVMQMPYNCLVV